MKTNHINKLLKTGAVCALAILLSSTAFADPLPSWKAGPAKRSIIEFVERVTDASSDDFVPVAERIAVFDNDGTLWSEAPVPPQLDFAISEVERLLPENPHWKDDPAVKALQEKDFAALRADHNKGVLDILAKSHAGRTTDEFNSSVAHWMKTAKHPKFGRSYDQTAFQPMLELLTYLRDHEFETWIVSGGGQDFMRVFAEATYGIEPQQVIGSYGQVKYTTVDGMPTFTKTIANVFVDDKDGKPEAIHRFIGRRPIAAFGNSDGDQAMIEYTTIGNPRPSFGLIVRHTDAEREYAYDAKPPASGTLVTGLKAAEEHGWTVVDMKNEWTTVFPQLDE